jgi:hypothetical protein
MLFASTDGTGAYWQPFSISYWHNTGLRQSYNASFADAHSFSERVNTSYAPRESQAYTSLVPLGNRSALVIYDRRAMIGGKLDGQIYSMVVTVAARGDVKGVQGNIVGILK